MNLWRAIHSPIGPLFLAASEDGLTRLAFSSSDPRKREASPSASNGDTARAEVHLDGAVRQLEEYFAGARREFELTIALHGTEFQKRVWRQIAAIPFGSVLSYGELAAAAGAPGASRAAGAACGANPVALIVPCHRVVAADRSLHGFGGGLEIKQWLLDHEGVRLARHDARQAQFALA
jgi:methylated-DNA-[protein]-cysteine S-methyltransferase